MDATPLLFCCVVCESAFRDDGGIVKVMVDWMDGWLSGVMVMGDEQGEKSMMVMRRGKGL